MIPVERVAHVRDAAWLIELWLAIHGGDPAPEPVRVVQNEVGELATVRAIVALARCLENRKAVEEINAALQPVVGQLSGGLRRAL